jgi:hypothetical protein
MATADMRQASSEPWTTGTAEDDDFVAPARCLPVASVVPSWRVGATTLAGGIDAARFDPWPGLAEPSRAS